jgi:hypothetical protein
MAVAGTVTLTVTNVGGSTGALKCSLAWTSDASGNVTGDALNLPAGSILTVEFIPGAGGVQPTDLYDVDLLDANATSCFDDGAGASIGANLSNALSTHKAPFINGAATTFVREWLQGAAGGNPYQLTVANAGNAKAGTVNIFVIPTAV